MSTLPTPEALRRQRLGLLDLVVILGVLLLLGWIGRVGTEALVQFRPPEITPSISLDPRQLPDYASRSMLRMLVALFCSTVFSVAYGSLAAHRPWAEKVLIPLLDILQSVPVLGFLSITVTGFIALFPGSLMGLEAASIFAIFTSQVWNMTFAFYQSLRTLPREMVEASTLYRLTRWQRFSRLELPAAAIPLLWNAMMSFGGGWFFLAASESISVLNQNYTLPGIGSYVTAAVAARDMTALGWAIVTVALVIVLTDQLFWRPLVAWSDRFRQEQSSTGTAADSWLLDLLRRARIISLAGELLGPVWDALDQRLSHWSGAVTETQPLPWSPARERRFNQLLVLLIGGLGAVALHAVLATVGTAEVGRALGLGLLTLGRVAILMVVASLVWTPIGVLIGFQPRLANMLQPVVQFLSSFPANFLFPFATLALISAHISINWGAIVLMALGSQWYLLFNSIAGAQMIPNDMREMAADIGLTGWPLWRQLILPGIFSAWVTGAVTACGGAWNASIVAEVVRWGPTTLRADGLGAYIADATSHGDWPRITLGIAVMALFVVGTNHLIWQRLYRAAESRFHL